MFYLHFIWNQKKISEKFWQQNVTSAPVSIWRGFAFENVCFNHVEQIKRSLGISGVITETSAWSKKEDDADGTNEHSGAFSNVILLDELFKDE